MTYRVQVFSQGGICQALVDLGSRQTLSLIQDEALESCWDMKVKCSHENVHTHASHNFLWGLGGLLQF